MDGSMKIFFRERPSFRRGYKTFFQHDDFKSLFMTMMMERQPQLRIDAARYGFMSAQEQMKTSTKCPVSPKIELYLNHIWRTNG